jgi:hypothetical protein
MVYMSFHISVPQIFGQCHFQEGFGAASSSPIPSGTVSKFCCF